MKPGQALQKALFPASFSLWEKGRVKKPWTKQRIFDIIAEKANGV